MLGDVSFKEKLRWF